MSRLGLTLCFSLLLVCTQAHADAPAGSTASDRPTIKTVAPQKSDDFYGKREQGWYWYQRTAQKKKKKPEEKKPPVARTTEQPPRDYSYNKLWKMNPDKFQAYLKRVTKYAVQYPTVKNVRRYLTVQDIARRKSVAFASVVAMVGQGNPEYSNADVFPITAPGRISMDETRLNEENNTIENASDGFALIMFSKEGCSFCQAQRGILKFFENQYGWPIRDIDINQRPGMAARFGVEETPTLILVQKSTGSYMPISAGVISSDDLRDRVYRSVRLMEGKIKPEQWNIYGYEQGTGNDPLRYIDTEGREQKSHESN